MKSRRVLCPPLRRLLFIGTNQLSRAALRAPTRVCKDDALNDLLAAEAELSCLIRCLRHSKRKDSKP